VLRFVADDGVVIEADARGREQDPSVVLLHGGGQTRHAWSEAAQALSQTGFYVVAPDLRGHGRSGWSSDGDYSVARHASDLGVICRELGRQPIVVGASLGGLTALVACGEAPQIPAATVVLVDVAHRAQAHGISRIMTFMRGHPNGFGAIEEAAAAVAAYLPRRAAPPDLSGLKNNLRLREDGRWHWHWDPRLLDAFTDLRSAIPAEPRLLAAANAVPAPLVLVRGLLSDVVDETIAEELITRVPGAQLVQVSGAGHMVAGDKNDRFVHAIVPALRRASEQASETEGAVRAIERYGLFEPAQPNGHEEGYRTEGAHALRTAQRLGSWGVSPPLQRAAVAHALYERVGPSAPEPLARDRLRREIGSEAERLVYAYGSTDRSFGFPFALRGTRAVHRDRFTGEEEDLSVRDARDLLSLSAASEVDHWLHGPGDLHDARARLESWLPRLPATASANVRALLSD